MNKNNEIEGGIFTPIAILFSGLLISLAIIVGLEFAKDRANAFDISTINCTDASPLSRDCLIETAYDLDLNLDKFVACVDEDTFADQVQADYDAGVEYGVQGTPTVFLGKGEGDSFQGFYVGTGVPYENLADLIEHLEENSVEDTVEYWIDEQISSLDGFEKQVEDYYKSVEGGELKGEELQEAVAAVVDDTRQRINNDHQLKELEIGDGFEMGDGEVVFMEFSDYECPFCQQFAEETLEQIKSDYVDSGRVRFVFRDFPLDNIHPNARLAAEAARCAGDQDRYFDYHDQLFNI